MHNRIKWLIGMMTAIAAILLISFLFTQKNGNQTANEGSKKQQSNVTANDHGKSSSQNATKDIADSKDSVKVKAEEIVNHMTLEEKVGQLFMVGFQSPQPDEQIEDLIKNKHIGNVILFDRNMQTKDQVKKLNNQLQNMAQKSTGLPLLIGVDQEGGDIVRMRDQLPTIPSQQELGKGTRENVLQTAKNTSKELAQMGFNTNFAPVLDLSATDSRSFGKDPEETFVKGSAVIEGFHSNGITGTLKHFPGNGRSNIDPHEETSSVQASQEELEKTDAYPFKKMIETVDPDDFFVMVTHIKYPAYDKDRPASLSPIIMQDVLRKRFGFKGIIVTDDFEMGAVSKYYPYDEIGVKALNAGADLIMICHVYDHQVEMYDGVMKAAKNGSIKESRINDAATRIIEHKLKMK